MGLTDASAQEGVRRVALRYLDQAAKACERLERGDDDDGADGALHAFRVGTRRLRSWLRAFDDVLGRELSRKQRRRLKRIASATNPGRDAEVQLDWVQQLGAGAGEAERAGVTWLAERMDARMREAYGDVREGVVADFRKLERRLRRRLSTYTVTFTVGEESALPTFGAIAAVAMEAQLGELVAGLSEVRSIEDEVKAHDARIHGKRLRYLVEPLRAEHAAAKALVKQLKALQDLLGDLNDLHNLRQTAGRALEDTALAQARELRAAAESGTIEAALEADERAGLVALLARTNAERRRRFDELLGRWLAEGGELDRLAADVRALTARLRDGGAIEIERKFLLREVPPVAREHASSELDQGYLPGRRIVERVRRIRRGGEETLVRTVKAGGTLRRIELEERCPPDVFETLWSLTAGRRVRKRRYAVPAGGLTWEIDELLDRELVLAEVELPHEDVDVPVPDWLAPYVLREVTEDPAYLNVNLAR